MSAADGPERRIFIGDIQGCREELEALLEALHFDPARDRLRPVGDLVNRGPDNVGVLQLLSDLGAEAVLGNHDLHLLGCATGRRWTGRRDTITDVLEHEQRDRLLDYLAAQPLLRVDDDLYQVHAALHPCWQDPAATLGACDPWAPNEDASFCTLTRYCDAAGRRPARDAQDPGAPFEPWHRHFIAADHAQRRVVYGHWAQAGLCRTEATLGLDTGCVWGGQLTAWVAEEDRLVQVPARRVYSAPKR